jgi:hypothetical protein
VVCGMFIVVGMQLILMAERARYCNFNRVVDSL